MPLYAGRKVSTPLIREFEQWLIDAKDRSSRTASAYRDTVEFFVGGLDEAGTLPEDARASNPSTCPQQEAFVILADPEWGDVSLRDLERFVKRPLASSGEVPSKSTRRRRVHGMKAFYEFLQRHGEIVVNPAANLSGVGVDIGRPKPIPDEHWLPIWDRDMFPEVRLALGLGYYLGFRRAEIIGVQPRHFNLVERRVTDFPRKGGKLNDVLFGANIDLLGRHLPHLAVRCDEWEDILCDMVIFRQNDDRLLAMTEHVAVDQHSSHINRALAGLCDKAGVPRYTPHQLRHSFGTNMFRCNMPPVVIADQMAHSNIETTRGYMDTTSWYEQMGVGSG